MHAQRLITRMSRAGFQGEETLLIYDEQQLTGTMLGDDIREVFDSRPAIARIYILAPFILENEIRRLLNSSSVFERMGSYFKAIGGRLCILTFVAGDNGSVASEIPFYVDDAGRPQQDPVVPISIELRNGWLFDLFDKYRGRVDAPVGVHFSKSSGRHSAKFLRVSNVLLSSCSCALIAFFTLATTQSVQPRRIFVDTAPLLGVAFALQRIALLHKIWSLPTAVTSFSSYGGLSHLPSTSGRDLVLVSASTSGGLVKELMARDFDPAYILTLFYLGAPLDSSQTCTVVCDLTFRQGRLFGYPQIESFMSGECPLCKVGYFTAELEGDQFQLEKRANKFLAIKTVSQTRDARELLERLARRQLIQARIFRMRGETSDFVINADRSLTEVPQMRARFIRALRRYTPIPLNYIVLVGLAEVTFKALIIEAGLATAVENAVVLTAEQLPTCVQLAQASGTALVVFGTLSNFATARDINAQLRIKTPKGCVSYLSAITLANSAEHLADLKMFLTYGEYGRDTHTYDSCATFMLPAAPASPSPWDLEISFLQRLVEDGCVELEIMERIDKLLAENERVNGLFWPGGNGELVIQNDFVYLTVDTADGAISQADILTTVANLLVTVRMDNRGLTSPVQAGKEPIRWHQSVYGHVVLSPMVFEDYNDAVLQAAFLRSASPAELNYANDAHASQRVLTIVRAAIQAWVGGGGDSLPEFLIALATCRMILTAEHLQIIKDEAAGRLPPYLKKIASKI